MEKNQSPPDMLEAIVRRIRPVRTLQFGQLVNPDHHSTGAAWYFDCCSWVLSRHNAPSSERSPPFMLSMEEIQTERSWLWLNMALAIECAYFLVHDASKPFSVVPVQPGHKHLIASPDKYREVKACPAGKYLMQAVLAVEDVKQLWPTDLGDVHPLLRSFISMLSEIYSEPRDHSGALRSAAVVTCSEVCLSLHQRLLGGPTGSVLHEEHSWMVDRVNESVEVFRKGGGKLRRAIARWEKPTMSRQEEARDRIKSLWDIEEQPWFIVRLDLGIIASENGVDPYQLRTYFEQFLNNSRFKLRVFSKIACMVWRLVPSSENTYHYHCLFVLNANLAGHDPLHATLIGEYWMEVTCNQGWYMDCANHLSPYCTVGIGAVEAGDQDKKRGILDEVLPYFTDYEAYFKISIPLRELSAKPKQGGWHFFGTRCLSRAACMGTAQSDYSPCGGHK